VSMKSEAATTRLTDACDLAIAAFFASEKGQRMWEDVRAQARIDQQEAEKAREKAEKAQRECGEIPRDADIKPVNEWHQFLVRSATSAHASAADARRPMSSFTSITSSPSARAAPTI